MPKKKNKKFKKSPGLVKPQITSNIQETIQATSNNTIQEPIQEKKIKDEYDISVLNEKYQPIRKDVFKLMIVLASLVVVFIAIYMVGTKTTALDNIGGWLYKISNIQTQ